MTAPRSLARWFLAVIAPLVFLAAAVSAQTLSLGTIEGRVINTRAGEYLERARVTVEGTTLEAFSHFRPTTSAYIAMR